MKHYQTFLEAAGPIAAASPALAFAKLVRRVAAYENQLLGQVGDDEPKEIRVQWLPAPFGASACAAIVSYSSKAEYPPEESEPEATG